MSDPARAYVRDMIDSGCMTGDSYRRLLKHIHKETQMARFLSVVSLFAVVFCVAVAIKDLQNAMGAIGAERVLGLVLASIVFVCAAVNFFTSLKQLRHLRMLNTFREALNKELNEHG
jgi:uncharacterized membrane protein required for colicin V production